MSYGEPSTQTISPFQSPSPERSKEPQPHTKPTPTSRILKIRHNLPSLAAILADERDDIRTSNSFDPIIGELNHRINSFLAENRQKNWEEHFDKVAFHNGQINLWKTCKGMTWPQNNQGNNIISFNNTHSNCVNPFNKQFTAHPRTCDKDHRRTSRRYKSIPIHQSETDRFDSLQSFLNTWGKQVYSASPSC